MVTEYGSHLSNTDSLPDQHTGDYLSPFAVVVYKLLYIHTLRILMHVMRKSCTTTFRGLWTLRWTAFYANRSTADMGLAVAWMGFCRGG